MKVEKIIQKLGAMESLLSGAAVLVEVLRVYPWMVFIGIVQGWGSSPFSLLSSLLVVGITAYVTKRTLASKLSLGKARLVTIGITLGVLLLLIRLEHGAGYAVWDTAWLTSLTSQLPVLLWSLAYGFYLLWRGTVVGREVLSSHYFYFNFAVGVAGFIVVVLLWTAAPGTSAMSALGALSPYVLGYFFVSLLAMGLCNFRERLRETGNAARLFTRRWLMILTSVAFVIVFIAAIIAGDLNAVSVAAILNALHTFATWLVIAFAYIVLYPIGILGEGIYYVMRFILSLFGTQQPFKPEQTAGPDLPKDLKDVAAWPHWLVLTLEWLLVLLLVAAVVYFLSKALYRYRRPAAEKEVDEIHQSLWSWAGFKADVLGFLRGLFARFRKKVSLHSAVSVPPVSVTSNDEAKLRDIRELYRGLLWEGRQAGVPRSTGETPYEYQQKLSGRQFSDEDVAAITDAYVQARYGHDRIDDGRLAGLARLWLRVRAAFRAPNSVS